MMRLSRLVPLALALAGRMAWAQDAALDALTSREDTLGWEAVGRLDTGDGGFCTGVLIATDLVLTAAHCVYDANAGFAPRDAGQMVFRAGLRQGEAVAEGRVAAYVAHPSYAPDKPPAADTVSVDVALLRLEAPVPAAVAAPFEVASLHAGAADVAVVSFATTRAAAPSIQRRCQVIGRQAGLYMFTCDVDYGSSGAPVFDLSGGRGRIVSIISAGNREGARAVSFGMDLPSPVEVLRRALRSGEGVVKAAQDEAVAVRRLGGPSRAGAGGARFVRPPAP